MPRPQPTLPFSAIRNSELFSNHWLEHRLPLEPEWQEMRHEAKNVLDCILTLWQVQKPRVEQYAAEQPLEQAFIQPVFEKLGWKLIYQTQLRGRKPDYALYESDAGLDASLAAGRNSEDFWKYPTLVADAKAWHVALDRPVVVNQRREYPPEQIESYLNSSYLDYAILTNGQFWRLVPRNHEAGQARFQTFIECNLPKLLNDITRQRDTSLFSPEFDDFLRLYLFFSPSAFKQRGDRPSLIARARAGSSEYRLGVGEGLKQRVFDALGFCVEGLLSLPDNQLAPAQDIERCREQSFTLLYRLLFVLFAEDRKLLPYRINPLYTDNRSLGRFRDEIAARLDRIQDGRSADYTASETGLWGDLQKLFDLIDTGASRYGVPAYNGGLFDPELHPFLAEKVLPDRYLARVVDQLGRAPDSLHPEAGLFRVDYRDLAIQHLGNVYEGLLELRPHYATEDMVVVRNKSSDRKEEKVVAKGGGVETGFELTGTKYLRGSVYLLTDKGERRATGSYYTPNHIVDYIVESTLGPILAEIDRKLIEEITAAEAEYKSARGDRRLEISARMEALAADFDDRVLRLRILDPSMGSGHFLLRACQFLAEQIATNPNAIDPVASNLQGDEPTLTFWKRRVVESCLYGVDRNSMAVELAKLALWLETVAVNQPLTFLDAHLRHGDSLVGATVADLGKLPKAGELMANLFEQQVQARLPSLLATLEIIRKTTSDNITQVKEKERLFRKTFEPVRTPFLRVADVWCSTFFLPEEKQVSLDAYKNLLTSLDKPSRLKALLDAEPYRSAVKVCGKDGIVAFHWELEFPEVFFGDAGRRVIDGFDAIIGNPPYDVLSEKESGRDLTELRDFLESAPIYKPSFVGKNNLYKLFVCRAVALLAEGGRLGFITPMSILGDEGASEVRRQILKVGAFISIDVFPQKDDPRRRVFREAKLSTAVFVMMKTSKAADRELPFISRVHPADRIDINSLPVELSTAEIPLYDPKNLTIISASQDDWTLAKRIMSSGRQKRLGDFAQCSQGEVNETVVRGKGHLLVPGQNGRLVLRGSNISLYVPRPASQGTDLWLDVASFLRGKAEGTKAFDHRYPRVGLQESSPQNNFRRIIACMIPAGEFCNHKVNYFSAARTRFPLELVVAILNSKLSDWYFRLGSTNAAVSHYQLHNLPFPEFATTVTADDDKIGKGALIALRSGKLTDVPTILAPGLQRAPFSPAVQEVLVEAVKTVAAIESQRGQIARTERSSLDPASQPFQDLIDRLLYDMAGLQASEVKALDLRLGLML
jgi:hypothetical protein